jgi:hypothetical protein
MNKMEIRIYETGGRLHYEMGRQLTLEYAQEIVGGLIEEFFPVEQTPEDGGYGYFCNEEGRLLDLPDNPFFPGIKGNVVYGWLD